MDEIWFKRLTIAVGIVGVLVAIVGALLAYYGSGIRTSAGTLEASQETLARIDETMREMRKESRDDFKELRAEIASERESRESAMREFNAQILAIAERQARLEGSATGAMPQSVPGTQGIPSGGGGTVRPAAVTIKQQ
ncbi:MAG: hypothetical protein OXI15_00660 [Chromatiales bacterium]|nr:hypothetical protein [Chromatiales bacterium]